LTSTQDSVSGSLPLRPEVRLQQRTRPRLADAAIDLRPVVAGRLLENARPVVDPTALRIVGAKIEPADTGEGDRLRAHRAGLKRDIEVADRQPLGLPGRRGGANYQQLGMGGGVVQLLDPVAGLR